VSSASGGDPAGGGLTEGDPTMDRLEDQIGWYDRKSVVHQRWYKWLKVVVLVIAALIPLLSGVQVPWLWQPVPAWVLGALGAVIAVIEGIQQLFQFQGNWISYRSTCEALKHEKFLYLAKAGPYAAAAVNVHALLAERVESLVSQENTKWASAQELTNWRNAAARDGKGDRGGPGDGMAGRS
jgi:hypothetical protein